jgi:hypothetical protein
LPEIHRDDEGLIVGGESLFRTTSGVVKATHAVQSLELHVGVADLPGEQKRSPVVVGGLLVPA